jgi:hypothetical protein
MRPFFPYYGSKWATARHYPSPVSPTVVEPFAGSAGYSCYYDVPQAVLVDKDPIIAGLWKYLIRTTPAEILSLPDIAEVGDCVDNYQIPQEAKWLIGFWLNRGSSTPKKRRTAYSARSDRGQLNWGLRAKERVASQVPLIRRWQVVEGDYTQSPPGCATWFIDPPYQDKGKYYRVGFDKFSELAAWSASRTGLTIICENTGADWLPFEALGRFKSSRGHSAEAVCIMGGS